MNASVKVTPVRKLLQCQGSVPMESMLLRRIQKFSVSLVLLSALKYAVISQLSSTSCVALDTNQSDVEGTNKSANHIRLLPLLFNTKFDMDSKGNESKGKTDSKSAKHVQVLPLLFNSVFDMDPKENEEKEKTGSKSAKHVQVLPLLFNTQFDMDSKGNESKGKTDSKSAKHVQVLPLLFNSVFDMDPKENEEKEKTDSKSTKHVEVLPLLFNSIFDMDSGDESKEEKFKKGDSRNTKTLPLLFSHKLDDDLDETNETEQKGGGDNETEQKGGGDNEGKGTDTGNGAEGGGGCKLESFCTKDVVRRIDAVEHKLDTTRKYMSQVLDVHVSNKNGDPGKQKNLRASSCEEAMRFFKGDSRIYILAVPNTNDSFFGYCAKDRQDGQKWLFIQRRQDGALEFDLNSGNYINGFGGPTAEHWLGLERIHAFTSNLKHSLWIKAIDLEGHRHSWHYDAFEVDSAESSYTLKELGQYDGDWEDPLRPQLGSKFSAKNWDNDGEKSKNCAAQTKGGWWFKDCTGTLNGAFKAAPDGSVQRVIPFAPDKPPFVYVHMAIRPTEKKPVETEE